MDAGIFEQVEPFAQDLMERNQKMLEVISGGHWYPENAGPKYIYFYYF